MGSSPQIPLGTGRPLQLHSHYFASSKKGKSWAASTTHCEILPSAQGSQSQDTVRTLKFSVESQYTKQYYYVILERKFGELCSFRGKAMKSPSWAGTLSPWPLQKMLLFSVIYIKVGNIYRKSIQLYFYNWTHVVVYFVVQVLLVLVFDSVV